MNYDDYYLRKEVEYILECSDATVRKLMSEGRLNKIKLGPSHSSRVLLLKTEVDSLKKELRLERLNRRKFSYKEVVKLLKSLDADDHWIEKHIK